MTSRIWPEGSWEQGAATDQLGCSSSSESEVVLPSQMEDADFSCSPHMHQHQPTSQLTAAGAPPFSWPLHPPLLALGPTSERGGRRRARGRSGEDTTGRGGRSSMAIRRPQKRSRIHDDPDGPPCVSG